MTESSQAPIQAEPCSNCGKSSSVHHPVTGGCPMRPDALWSHSNRFAYQSAADKRADKVFAQHANETWRTTK